MLWVTAVVWRLPTSLSCSKPIMRGIKVVFHHAVQVRVGRFHTPLKTLWRTLSVLFNVTSGLDQKFPKGFKFGAATAAYQIEGGWNVSDKSESIWDRAVHAHPEAVVGGGNGDVACDSYHNWRRDVQMVHELGLHFYRFSISWPRLLPNAFPTNVSESGKKYYNDLINYLLQKDIEPVITIYHWDLPQKLQDLGGWTNPLISDWFADFAEVVFALFADRVKTWITINEPSVMCEANYNAGAFAPIILEPEIAGLLCNKHVLIAHAKAWRIYDKEYKPRYHGKVTIGNHLMWIDPKTEHDEQLAEFARQSCAGQYSHPIYSKEGGWPPSVEKAYAKVSKKLGYARSKLPAFTKEEILLVRGTYDYYGINYYTSRLARRARPGEKPGFWFFKGHADFNIVMEIDPTWKTGGQPLIPSYPEGLRKQIAWLKAQYGDLEFLITENGCDDRGQDDHIRMEFIQSHLEQVLLSIKEDGANVTGYTYWTLMDNFEWLFGYDMSKFGLYEVDFKHPKRTRSPRASAHYFSHIAKKHSLDVPFPKKVDSMHHKKGNSATNNKTTNFHFVYWLSLVLIHVYWRSNASV